MATRSMAFSSAAPFPSSRAAIPRQLFEFDWRGLAPEHVEHQPATFDCDQSFRASRSRFSWASVDSVGNSDMVSRSYGRGDQHLLVDESGEP